MVVIPGVIKSISAVRCALDWLFHDLVDVERTRVNLSVSFVELGSVYAKHPHGYMGKPLHAALITAMMVSPCFTRWFSVFEFSLFTNEAQKAFTILNKNSFFFQPRRILMESGNTSRATTLFMCSRHHFSI